jgi:hypothetical protein
MDDNTAGLLRLHVKSAQLVRLKDGLLVRLAEVERKLAQLNELVKDPRLKRRVEPLYMKLKHDVGHQKRAAKVALHKSETLRDEIFRKPIDVAAVERGFEAALKVSARVSKELDLLNRSLDELLASCGVLN